MQARLTDPAGAPRKRARWFRADNIRYILLFNVIAEHMLTLTGVTVNAGVTIQANITEHWLVTVLVCWSRMITMPAFAFLSGYFSKKGDKCYNSALFDFLIPYIIFDSIFVLIYGSSQPNIFSPSFAYWYMISMFCWKIMTKALQRFRYIIPLSFAAALLAGLCPDVDNFLSLGRTISFLPYYLIGMKLTREDIAKVENLPKAAVLAVTLAVMGVWGYLNVRGWFHIDLFYYCAPYQGTYTPDCLFSYGPAKGLLLRALGYIVSGVLIVFLLVFVPDRSLPVIRDGGTRTMVPYLLHTYFIMFMRSVYAVLFGAYPWLNQWYVTIPVAVAMGVGVMALLSLPVLDNAYGAFIGFIKKILMKPEPEGASGA